MERWRETESRSLRQSVALGRPTSLEAAADKRKDSCKQ